MKPDELIHQWKGKDQKLQLIELVLFLSLASAFFYIFQTNMLMFGVFVYIGLAWLLYRTPNKKLSLITGVVGGFIGFCTEWWGCPNKLWTWTEPQISLYYFFGHPYGFPVEVVIAYFAAGLWIGKITLVLFEPQAKETIQFYENKEYNATKNLRITIALIVFIVSTTVFIIEPMYIQSMLLMAVGTAVFLTLPKRVMGIIGPFAILMGAIGFFFENFATGILPNFSVWEYDLSLYENLRIPNPIIGVAPFSAFIAYAGAGLILFGLSFFLNVFFNNYQK